MTVFRAYSASSYWNTPISAAPKDSLSDTLIGWLKSHNGHSFPGIQLIGAAANPTWGMPDYFSQSADPLYSITASGHTVQVRIPQGAKQAQTSDGAMVVIDQSSDQSVSLWQASFSNGKWSCNGMGRSFLSSNGLDGSLKESDNKGNFGHRGVPPAIMQVRKDEADSVIAHKLEVFVPGTADCHVFPMSGNESGKGGPSGMCEGLILRIKASVDLTKLGLATEALAIAKCLQSYGAVVGDNGHTGPNIKLENLQLEGKGNWTIKADALRAIDLSNYEFAQRAFGA